MELTSCQSTNDELALMADAPEGTVVWAHAQLAGRGQRGNTWEAQPGQNLTFSLLLRPTFIPASQQFLLNMAVSLAVHHALMPFIGDSLAIKWPNDVFVGQRKLGGILIESSLKGQHLEQAIIGIGINVRQSTFEHPQATSLALQCEHCPSPAEVLSNILHELERYYLQLRQGKRESMQASYQQLLLGFGEVRRFENKATGQIFHGKIQGVDEVGRLRIHTGQGQTLFFAFKEVVFLWQ